MILRALALALVLVIPARARDFDPKRDGMAFANETVFAYGVDEAGKLQMGGKTDAPAFSRRCFPVVRGVMQFWKFARFEPHAPAVSAEVYRERIRRLFRISAWHSARPDKLRIAFPGYADLWSFSKAHTRLVQEEIGRWWPSYFRVGNWRMPSPFVRLVQRTTAENVARDIAEKGPQALYLAKFPSMNHAVLAYASERLSDGKLRFRVYDPNYAGGTARLDFVPGRNLFDFEERFYWPGGDVRAMRIYLSPFH